MFFIYNSCSKFKLATQLFSFCCRYVRLKFTGSYSSLTTTCRFLLPQLSSLFPRVRSILLKFLADKSLPSIRLGCCAEARDRRAPHGTSSSRCVCIYTYMRTGRPRMWTDALRNRGGKCRFSKLPGVFRKWRVRHLDGVESRGRVVVLRPAPYCRSTFRAVISKSGVFRPTYRAFKMRILSRRDSFDAKIPPVIARQRDELNAIMIRRRANPEDISRIIALSRNPTIFRAILKSPMTLELGARLVDLISERIKTMSRQLSTIS